MSRRSTSFALIGLLLGVGVLGVGCATQRPYDELWVQARPYQSELDAARPEASELEPGGVSGQASSSSVPVATGELTLGEAVGLALEHNPGLKAAGWSVGAAEADALQMGRPPNPRAGLSVENFGESGGGPYFQRQTLRLSQVIELAGKRGKRQRLGEARQRLAAWDYETRRIEVAADTATSFVAVAVAQQRVDLARQQLELAEAGLGIAEDRVRAEVAPQRDADQARARVSLSRIELDQARQNLESDRADLASLWGAEQAGFDRVAGALEAGAGQVELDALKPYLSESPRVARWSDEVAAHRRAWELAKANAVVDPTVGGGVRLFPDADDVAGVVELGVPLQVFDDNRDAVRAARLRIAQARASKQQARASANQALSRAYTRYRAAVFALDSLQAEALPASESAYRSAREAYQAGVTDYLDVLDAERTLLDVRNRRLDAALAYHQSIVAIERLIARPLPDAATGDAEVNEN